MRQPDQFELIAAATGKNSERVFWEQELFQIARKENGEETIAAAGDNAGAFKSMDFRFSPACSMRAMQICNHSDTTLHVLLTTVLGCLISKVRDVTELLIGTSVFYQTNDQAALNSMIALRNSFLPRHSLKELLADVATKTKKAVSNQHYPVKLLIDKYLGSDNRSERFFDVTLTLTNIQEKFNGAEVYTDLAFDCERVSEEISCSVQYNSFRYTEAEVAAYCRQFEALLKNMMSDPDAALSSLSSIPPDELDRCLYKFNDTDHDHNRNWMSVSDVIEEQARLNPAGVALKWTGGELTFSQLAKRANQLAWTIRKKGLGVPNTVIGIMADRSPEMVIGIYGIIKSGAAYMPIEPSSSIQRLKYRLTNSTCRLLLYGRGIDLPQLGIETLDLTAPLAFDSNDQAPPRNNTPEDLAYVIYTSGSSGNPKGVMIEHAGLINRILWMQRLYPLSSKDVILQKTNFTFDVSVWEILWGVFSGATQYLSDKNVEKDPAQLIRSIQACGATVMHFVPSMLNVFLEATSVEDRARLESLKYVFASGEALSGATATAFYRVMPGAVLANLYGPTEASIDVTSFNCPREKELINLPIGKPIDNTRIFIVDKRGELSGIGIKGELCIGGVGVARGYIGNKELTDEKFIQPAWFNGRIYRTGDLASWTPEGEILYHGRLDFQVKFRGYRIEPGEIETAMCGFSGIVNAVAMVVAQSEEDKYLVAYYVAQSPVNVDELRAFLLSRLPEYMVPTFLMKLEKFPVTASGKIDRKQLPLPGDNDLRRKEFVMPADEMEEAVAGIWNAELRLLKASTTDNFFEAGGDSIKAIRFINRLRSAFRKDIQILDLYQHPTIRQLAICIQNALPVNTVIDETEKEIHAALLQIREEVIPMLPDHEFIEDVFPMTDIQSGMLFASLLEPELNIYRDQFLFRIPEAIDPVLFKKALEAMVQKHAILRTAFRMDEFKTGLQVVFRKMTFQVDLFHLPDQAGHLSETQIRNYLAEQRTIPYDHTTGPLWRAALFLDSNASVFVFQFHHAILDGWSVASFNRELNDLYKSFLHNSVADSIPLKCSYRDFVVESLIAKKGAASIDFWKNEMAGFRRLQIFGENITNRNFTRRYDKDFYQQLQLHSRQQQLPVKTIFFAAFTFALNMLGYEDECVIGLVTNNRPVMEDGDKVLGCFLNTVPLKISTAKEGGLSWIGLVKGVDEKLQTIKPFEKTTLLDIARATGYRVSDQNPFFDVSFNYTNFHIYEELGGDFFDTIRKDVSAHDELSHELTNTFLNFTVNTTGDTLSIKYRLRKNFRSGKSIEDVDSYLNAFLHAFMTDGHGTASREALLPAQEKNELLDRFAPSSVGVPAVHSLISLIEKRVSLHPDKIAVVFEQERLSYAELDRRAAAKAGGMAALGVKSGDFVIVSVKRSAEVVISILAVLKLGAIFVPVAPDYPAERLQYILHNTGASICLCDEQLRQTLISTGTMATLLPVDAGFEDQPFSVQHDIPYAGGYVIYTSGSTGNPKGVLVPDAPLIDHLFGVIDSVGAANLDSAAIFASLAADAGYSILFSVLMTGGCVHILSDSILLDGARVAAYLHKENISFIKLVPSLWMAYAEEGIMPVPLKAMMFGGEAFNPKIPALLRQQGYQGIVFNHYGPTETTIGKCIHTVNLDKTYHTVPVGRPFSNTVLYIVDKQGNLLPKGVAGELWIGGKGLAAGYLNAEELTAKAFVKNPFAKNGDERCYRTGDLCRWNTDGEIEFLGRLDEQVKINGHRIELADIEFEIARCSGVSQAAVIVKKNTRQQDKLFAYIVVENTLQLERLKQELRDKLPDYMIPSAFVVLESMPVNHIGKTDKKALPDPDLNTEPGIAYVAPRNHIEEKLVQIWQDVLGIETVGIYDNFFELGGDSISTIQLASRARKLNIPLEPKHVFEQQQIALISKLIDGLHAEATIAEQGVLQGRTGLLPSQAAFFANNRDVANDVLSHYNQSVLLNIDKNISKDILELTIKWLTDQHDALRLGFRCDESQWTAFFTGKTFKVESADLSKVSPSDWAQAIKTLGDAEQKGLSISDNCLARFILIESPAHQEHNRFLVVLHHLLVDVVSWRILFDDLKYCLEKYADGDQPVKRQKTSSVRDWHQHLDKYAGTSALIRQTAYWTTVAAEKNEIVSLPSLMDKPLMRDIRQLPVEIPEHISRQLLQEIPAELDLDVNILLLTAFAMAIENETGKTAPLIRLEGHGREEQLAKNISLSDTVGWFTAVFPVRIGFNEGRDDLMQQLALVKESLRSIPDHGISYGILKYLRQEKAVAGEEPGIVFNYLGKLDTVRHVTRFFSTAAESAGNAVSPNFPANFQLMVIGRAEHGKLVFDWSYSNIHFEQQQIMALARAFADALQQLAGECLKQKAAGKKVMVPADFGLSTEISVSELNNFLSAKHNNGSAFADNIESIRLMSPVQQGMLFHSLMDKHDETYVQQLLCDFENPDLSFFEQCWTALFANHTILRTAFFHEAFSVLVQCVLRKVTIPFNIIDLSHLEAGTQEVQIEQIARDDRRAGFDFAKAPLLRLTMIRLSGNTYRMIKTSHHILYDGWSMAILMDEFLKTYDSLQHSGKPLHVRKDDYGDFISYLSRVDKQNEQDFWVNYLSPLTGSTLFGEMQTDSSPVLSHEQRYIEDQKILEEQLTALAKEYCRRNGITLNTLFQGVWARLLHSYLSTDRIAFGVTVSGRPDDLPDIESRVGLYINTLPLVSVLQEHQSVKEWLKAIQQEQLQAREFQFAALNDIHQWSGSTGNLFDTTLTFQNYPVSDAINRNQGSLKISNLKTFEQNNFPLSITIDISGRILMWFRYNRSVFSQHRMAAIMQHFENLVRQFAEQDVDDMNSLEIISAEEKQELLQLGAGPSFHPAAGMTIIDHLAKTVKAFPDGCAIEEDGLSFSFEAIDRLSSLLAGKLIASGISREQIIPVCCSKGRHLMIAILGVFKSGCAYLPVIKETPVRRVSSMLEDTSAVIGICDELGKDLFVEAGLKRSISIESLYAAVPDEDYTVYTSVLPSVRDLAYVIFTSGSTGRPKGVLIEHGSLINYLRNPLSRYTQQHTEEGAGSFLHLSAGFDASITALLMPVLDGRPLRAALDSSSRAFATDAFWSGMPYDFIKLTPSHLPVLQHEFETRKQQLPAQKIVVGGEQLHYEHLRFLSTLGKSIIVINEYGPTEATVGCCVYEFNAGEQDSVRSGPVPVGRPMGNVSLYILDRFGKLVPKGFSGELYIGGDQVARGYLNRPDLTDEKFLSDPFRPSVAGRMYKTGDLCRWNAEGNLEFIGRIDEQMKIDGYRIEPGEIEAAILTAAQVSQVCVTSYTDHTGSQRLAAYILALTDFSQNEMIAHLEKILPGYMIPSRWLLLETMPLTANGKADRKMLDTCVRTVQKPNMHEETMSEAELNMLRIWKQILDVDTIGVEDNFFDAGGHSLLAIRLVSAIKREMNIQLSIGDIFDYPTIRSLASLQQPGADETGEVPIPKADRNVKLPLSFSQERLWFIDKLQGSTHYHLPSVVRLKGKLDTVILEKAFITVIQRHESLHSVFVEENGEPYVRFLDPEKWELRISQSDFDSEEALQQYQAGFISTAFSLQHDYMIRAELIRLDNESHLLLIVLHHIASDGWSSSIMVKELMTAYTAGLKGEKGFPGKPVLQYPDFAAWQRQYLSGDLLAKKLSYWENRLQGVTPLELPTDFNRGAMHSIKGKVIRKEIKADLRAAIDSRCHELLLTPFMFMLGAFNVLLSRYTGSQDICVGTPVAGRNDQRLESLIGFFVNTIAVRSYIDEEKPFIDMLLQLRENLLRDYEHQDVPFEKIVEKLVREREWNQTPLFQVMFVMQNNEKVKVDPAQAFGGVTVEAVGFEQTSSKFDLTLHVDETRSGYMISAEYSSDLFKARSIDRLLNHFVNLLENLTEQLHMPVGQVAVLKEKEILALRALGCGNFDVPYSRERTVIDLFENRVDKMPWLDAVAFGNKTMTYGELHLVSNQVAHLLKSHAVGREVKVAICMNRGFEMIVAMMAVLKAGGAYVPVDPAYPPERISYILDDSEASLLLTDNANSHQQFSLPSVVLQLDETHLAPLPEYNLERDVDQHTLAYIIYTSGSTGKPKGVMIEHGNLIRLFETKKPLYDFSDRDTWTLFHSFSFDFSVWEIFGPLTSGGKLVITPEDISRDTAQFARFIQEKKVTVLNQTPSAFYVLQEEILRQQLNPSLRYVIFGGEMLNPIKTLPWLNTFPGCRLINMYGITEITVHATFHELVAENISSAKSIIGTAIPTLSLYVADRFDNLCPVGVAGELWVGGAGVARGYQRQPALTAEKFPETKLNGFTTGRLYRTGDICRWLDDGTLEYLGRRDEQVKIRGYRIELPEIEAVLLRLPGMRRCAVLAGTSAAGDKQLVGYVVTENDFDQEKVMMALRIHLPEYMIPYAWIKLDALPINANGKIDRRALPDAKTALLSRAAYTAPSTATEKELCSIWQQLLNVPKVGTEDNFFALGGHSLLGVRLLSMINTRFSIDMSLRALFDFRTIANIAGYIDLLIESKTENAVSNFDVYDV
ncbi:MAG: amino acid adenylation domain-containing protein [Chitinophagaceae bacterium]